MVNNMKFYKKSFERSIVLWLILALLGVLAIILLNLETKDQIVAYLDNLKFFG